MSEFRMCLVQNRFRYWGQGTCGAAIGGFSPPLKPVWFRAVCLRGVHVLPFPFSFKNVSVEGMELWPGGESLNV